MLIPIQVGGFALRDQIGVAAQEFFSLLIAGACQAEQRAGKNLVDAPAAHRSDRSLRHDDSVRQRPQNDQPSIGGSLCHKWTMTGDDELNAWEHALQSKADLALPDRMQMGIDFINQHHTLGLNLNAIRLDLYGTGKVAARFLQMAQQVNDQGKETAKAIAQVWDRNFGASDRLKKDSLGINPGDTDPSGKQPINDPSRGIQIGTRLFSA